MTTDDGRLSGRIVETEVYLVGEIPPVTHFAERREAMAHHFLDQDSAHVYFTYGSSFMLNVTSEAAGVGAGVLLARPRTSRGNPIGCKASAAGQACSI